MSDKARELLERAMESLDGGFLYRLELKEKIRAYLAEPTPDEEPVAWLYSKGDVLAGVPVVFTSATIGKDFAFQEPHYDQKPLYPHPAPRPDFVRLSEEEVNEILSSAYTPYEAVCATENRLVEKNKCQHSS